MTEYMPPHGKAPILKAALCKFCGHSTPAWALAKYGARCEPCYAAYLKGEPGRLPK